MKGIEEATQKRIELSNPQMTGPIKATDAYVMRWKSDAEKALKTGNKLTKHRLEPEHLTETLYHWAKSSVSGVWFISLDGKSVDYLYAYRSIRLDSSGKHKAAEALAYLFNTHVRGVTKGVFFNHLLPSQKFVVTDFMYTQDGRRWFEAEYNEAFRRGYNVYALDMTRKVKIQNISQETFRKLQPLYWGDSEEHQKYRFAIELP